MKTSSLSDIEIVEVELDSCAVLPAETEVSTTRTDDIKQSEAGGSAAADDSSGATSSALQLNKASCLSLEDPVKLMDSILNENGAMSQNINLLGQVSASLNQKSLLLKYTFKGLNV